MINSPKRTRWGKISKSGFGSLKGDAGGSVLAFGDFGLMACEGGRISARQLEACRRTIRRAMLRTGQMWVRIRPTTPVTKKPIEVRMGGGAGSIKYWAATVKPGVVMFEVFGVLEPMAVHALSCGGKKLPVKTKIVRRSGMLLSEGVSQMNSSSINE